VLNAGPHLDETRPAIAVVQIADGLSPGDRVALRGKMEAIPISVREDDSRLAAPGQLSRDALGVIARPLIIAAKGAR
jgi:hypothetical protein